MLPICAYRISRLYLELTDDALCRVVIDEDTSRSICRDTVNLSSQEREGCRGRCRGRCRERVLSCLSWHIRLYQ